MSEVLTTLPATAANEPELRLESVVCGRCGGSGKFGPTCVWNGICFGCSGSGRKYTKRGAAAALFLEHLREVPIETLKVGETVRQSSITMGGQPFDYWAEVTAVAVVGTEVHVETASKKFGPAGIVAAVGHKVRKGWGAEEKIAQLRAAVAYQATLTKLGKPRVVRGKAKREAA